MGTLAVRALRRLHEQPRPWLLAVGFIRPHLPFNVPARYWAGAEAAARHAPTGTEARAPAGLSDLSASHVRAGDGELFDFAHRPEMRIRRRLKPDSPEDSTSYARTRRPSRLWMHRLGACWQRLARRPGRRRSLCS